MRAVLPYHFCEELHCEEMVSPGTRYCAGCLAILNPFFRHPATVPGFFVPEAEDDFADARQQPKEESQS